MNANERKNEEADATAEEEEDRLRLAEALHDLRLGAIRGDLQAVKVTLAKGLTVNQPLKGGWTALMYACSLGHPALVDYLLQRGANPNFHKELFTPLMAACASTQAEDRLVQCVDSLLAHKANVNTAERHHISALMFAAKEGHAKVVARLLASDVDCDLNAQDSQGWTALFWAVNQGRSCVVELLVRKGAKVDVQDRRGHTALGLAHNKGFDQMVDMLTKKQCGPVERQPGLKDSGDRKHKYVFGKGADTMLQALLDELSGNNNNGRSGNNFSKFINNMELENNIEILKGQGLISKIAQSLNGCFQNSIVLPNKHLDSDLTCQNRPMEMSWKAMPYSAVEAREILSHTVRQLEALFTGVSYVRLHMQGDPPAALLQDKHARIAEVTLLSSKALHCSRLLCDELHFLHRYAKQLEESDRVVPADLVTEQKTDRHHAAIVSSLVVAAAVVVLLFNTRVLTFSVFSK